MSKKNKVYPQVLDEFTIGRIVLNFLSEHNKRIPNIQTEYYEKDGLWLAQLKGTDIIGDWKRTKKEARFSMVGKNIVRLIPKELEYEFLNYPTFKQHII